MQCCAVERSSERPRKERQRQATVGKPSHLLSKWCGELLLSQDTHDIYTRLYWIDHRAPIFSKHTVAFPHTRVHTSYQLDSTYLPASSQRCLSTPSFSHSLSVALAP